MNDIKQSKEKGILHFKDISTTVSLQFLMDKG